MNFRRVSTMLSGMLPVLASVIVLALAGSPASAQEKPADVPDVVVMVLSGALPSDAVSFTYKTVVPESVAEADLQSVLKNTGWTAEETSISKSSAGPEMTSVEFQTNGAVNWGAGVLLVEPFAVAFKRFDLVQINYLLQGNMQFRSLRDFSNRFVDIKWTSTDNSQIYTIKIKDHNFDKLDLPLIVDPPQQAQRENVESPSRSGGTKTLAAILIALAAGAMVFGIVSRVTRK